jgi:hypothetical protein
VLAENTVSPASASYPTSQWRAGDVLQGQHRITVPAHAAPGNASVVLSVVDPDGRPLTAHPLRWLPIGDTDVRLATIEIASHENMITEAPSIQHPLNARLSDMIDLLGYDLDPAEVVSEEELQFAIRNSQPVLSSAEVFAIELFWRTNVIVDGNFKVTVQVLSSDNQVVAQHDSVPANWARPTTGWRPGEVIADLHTLTVDSKTPPGTYQLIAAMYDPVNNSRLPVIQAGESRDHIVLGSLIVR